VLIRENPSITGIAQPFADPQVIHRNKAAREGRNSKAELEEEIGIGGKPMKRAKELMRRFKGCCAHLGAFHPSG